MDDGQLTERGNALEEEFFRKQNAELLARMRAEQAIETAEAQMAAALGVNDSALVEQLLAHGVTPATIAAVSLAPLVLVAWADGTLEEQERKAVAAGASSAGIAAGSTEHELLESWLAERPADSLMATWSAYVRGVIESLDEQGRTELRDSIIRRTTSVANAAGGFLGRNKVSDAEREVMDKVEAVLKA